MKCRGFHSGILEALLFLLFMKLVYDTVSETDLRNNDLIDLAGFHDA